MWLHAVDIFSKASDKRIMQMLHTASNRVVEPDFNAKFLSVRWIYEWSGLWVGGSRIWRVTGNGGRRKHFTAKQLQDGAGYMQSAFVCVAARGGRHSNSLSEQRSGRWEQGWLGFMVQPETMVSCVFQFEKSEETSHFVMFCALAALFKFRLIANMLL